MQDNIRWKLVYSNDACIVEEESGSTILHRWKSPKRLQVLRGDSLVWDRPLMPGEYPIFYRNRGLTMDGGGHLTTDATVFGAARVGNDSVDCQLWAWNGAEVIDCPTSLIAQNTIEFLVSNAPETLHMV